MNGIPFVKFLAGGWYLFFKSYSRLDKKDFDFLIVVSAKFLP
jgi:hypothetical protein